jgi:hypothetical protein
MKSYIIILEYITLLTLLIATICSGYIFIETNVFKSKNFTGFYNNWQFPMLLAMYSDLAYYNHIPK